MTLNAMRRFLSIMVAVVVLFLGLIYFGGVMGYRGRTSNVQFSSPKISTGVLAESTVLKQSFFVMENNLSRFALRLFDGAHPVFTYSFSQGDEILAQGAVDQTDGAMTIELLQSSVPVHIDTPVQLVITVGAGNDASFAYGDTYQLTHGEAAIPDLNATTCLFIADQQVYGRISAEASCVTYMEVERPFLIVTGILIVLTVLCALWIYRDVQKGRNSLPIRIVYGFCHYWFVMSQMIGRDFKTKYKRSVLGVFWSFLNPLLTMGVQYVVFSTLFKSSIPYFPVYLMTGIVCFTFFSEGTTAGLNSITSNASLMTKVYIPKYIFPVSRVLSAGINYLFSLIPLLIIILLSRLPITRAYLLLPYVMVCLLLLITGVAMLLGTMMVFFHDVQFLWSVAISLMMYATPIFYPETILAGKLLIVAKLNPLYHVIRFMRVVIIDGASPEPKAYLLCFIACAVPALIGVWMFKRNQDKFVLNL